MVTYDINSKDKRKGRQTTLTTAHELHLLKTFARGNARVVKSIEVALLTVLGHEKGLCTLAAGNVLVDDVQTGRDGLEKGAKEVLSSGHHGVKLTLMLKEFRLEGADCLAEGAQFAI